MKVRPVTRPAILPPELSKTHFGQCTNRYFRLIRTTLNVQPRAASMGVLAAVCCGVWGGVWSGFWGVWVLIIVIVVWRCVYWVLKSLILREKSGKCLWCNKKVVTLHTESRKHKKTALF